MQPMQVAYILLTNKQPCITSKAAPLYQGSIVNSLWHSYVFYIFDHFDPSCYYTIIIFSTVIGYDTTWI